MAAEIGSSVAGKAIDSLFDHVQRELGYLLCFNNNIQDLETELGKLKAAKNDIEKKEAAERRNCKTMGESAELWIVQANKKITEAEDVINEKAELQKGCFSIKWCPNLKLRFSLGRKGKKLSLDLKNLLQRGGVLPLTVIDLDIPRLHVNNNGDASDFESRKKIMEVIIEMLLDKETKLIGICGMPGIGKTTLAKQVLQKVHDFHNNLFDFQVILTVSRPPNFNSIQQQVVERLKGPSLKEIENETERAERLLNAFNNKKVVVLLDDVWDEFDLNEKGFPLKESDCCKIIYTSRIQKLWVGEGTIRKKEISLELLLNDESWNLFRRKANLHEDDNDFHSKNEIAIEIVKECDGLPLALSITGGALLKKNTYHWEDMLNRMKNHHDPHSKIKEALKTSYDFLEKDNEKLLFLICCLFQEDQLIPVETLRRYAAGLHLFKDTSDLREIRMGVHTAVDNLIMKNLLIEVDDLVYMERAVKMHDVVRDVGISIAKQGDNGFNFLVWDGVKNLETDIGPDTKMISILIQNMDMKVPDMMEFCGSKLELLQLDMCDNVILPDNLYEWTKNLKVLVIVGKMEKKLSYFSYPAKLKMLSLENLNMISNMFSIRHLNCLEILSLRYSIMEVLPNEISELTSLRLLDLTGNKCFIGNGILSKLTNLQELYMCNSFVNWRGLQEANEDNNASAELIELNCLQKLQRVELEVFNIEQVPRDGQLLSSSHLLEFKIIMGKIRRKCLQYFELRERQLLEILERGERQLRLENVKDNSVYNFRAIIEKKVTNLHLFNTSGIWEQMHLKGFLKDIVFKRCESIITLFSHSKSDAEEINGIGRHLLRIKISECKQLRYLFPISMTTHLKNLQVLVVKKCEVLDEVVSICKNTEELAIIEFNALEILKLNDLCQLKCFCKGINEIRFNKLKTLKLKGLKQFIFPAKLEIPCLEKLDIRSIPNLQNLCNFLPPSLKEMRIYNCDDLRYVFSDSLARNSNFHLQYLYIEGCKMLEGIVFVSMGAEEKGDNISFQFPNLSSLHLNSLEELESFVIDNEEKSESVLFYQNQVSFPRLGLLTMEKLPKINYIVGCKGRTKYYDIKEEDDYDKKLQILFPILSWFVVNNLSNLIHVYKSNHPEGGALLFPNAHLLAIYNCEKLRYLFSENIVRVAAKHFMRIDITDCPLMEVVMKNEEDEELGVEDDKAKAESFFPLLEDLYFDNLPVLRRFYDVAYTLTLPSLKNVTVSRCPKLEALSTGYLNSPNLDSFEYENIAENWKGDINAALRDIKIIKEEEKEEMEKKKKREDGDGGGEGNEEEGGRDDDDDYN